MTTALFTELPLSAPLQQAIAAAGYHTPTPIQAAAIPQVLAGRDLLGCAQTGTGKTAAFALPILHQLERDRRPAVPRRPRVLVLSPTRELAAQIAESFETYGRNVDFRQAVIFGGVGQSPQVQALTRGVHVLVATPGRLLDLMAQGHLRLDRVEVLVLDEADRMLDMGFLPALRRILAALPDRRQSLFFSATMPREVAELAGSLLVDPACIAVTPPSSTVASIEQCVLFVEPGTKSERLRDLLAGSELAQVLVFTRTKRRADVVARQLRAAGIDADAIHGDKTQSARSRALLRFRAGRTRVLVATDLAARGLDVDGISHVINYDLPREPESYVHRIGRTGRAGASGVAFSFCEPGEAGLLRAIERETGRSLSADGPLPGEGLATQPGGQPPQRRGAERSRQPPRRRRFRQRRKLV
ncbi:MAG TPA: DEAD/DEAH box helicase [Planctomycetaceae bacterium]|nr:DEAD/DEAH box helicase [Planctomycetaceae bacterium]